MRQVYGVFMSPVFRAFAHSEMQSSVGQDEKRPDRETRAFA